MIVTGWTIAWGIAAVIFLVLGIRRDKSGRAYAPWSFFWFAAISAVVSAAWPLIQSGPLGGYVWWLVVAWVLAGLLVAFARFGVAMVAAVALALLMFVPLAPAAAQQLNSTAAAPTPSPTSVAPLTPTEQVKVDPAAANVYPDRYLTLLKDRGYKIESVDGQQLPVFATCSTEYDKKQWTDAICPKLDPKDRASVIVRILASPDYAAHVASGLSRVELIQLDGKKASLKEINPWLEEFSDPAKINDWAQSAMSAQGTARVDAARKMAAIAILTDRFSDGGVQGGRETAFNYHLADGKGGSLAVDPTNPMGTIPEFALSPKQYKGEFVVFRVTYKGYEGCFAEFGINTGDGRFAGFTCEQPKPEKPTTPQPPQPPKENVCTAPSGEQFPAGDARCNPVAPPPPPAQCTAPDGSKYPEGDERCNPVPPPPPAKCTAPDGNQYPEGDPRCNPEPPKCTAPDGSQYPEGDPRCNPNTPKDPKDDPPAPEEVDPQPQPDPVESEPPAQPEQPVDPGEQPGSGGGDVPADNTEDNTDQQPSGPPAGGEGDNPGSSGGEDNPADDTIVDPDAAAAGFAIPLLGLGLLRRRKVLSEDDTE